MKKEAMLYEKQAGSKVRCNLCAHRCVIDDSKFGFCGVRQNMGGTLYTLVYAEAIANHVDPIEKKPLYHFLPGSSAYSIATIGCNFRCGFCQNWQISQTSKNDKFAGAGYRLTPEEIVADAIKNKCSSISYTYTEPTIFFEYAYDTAVLAKKAGLYNNFVTNGFMTKEAIDTIRPYLDAANIDLKAFNDETYKTVCKGRLAPVLDSIKYMWSQGMWVEVTTLIVPGMNDSDKELNDIALFLASVSTDLPWHISRFHPDYQYTDVEATPIETLERAEAAGRRAGLKYIYLGNVLEGLDTNCSECGQLLIKRGYMYTVCSNLEAGKCPKCKTVLPGVFS